MWNRAGGSDVAPPPPAGLDRASGEPASTPEHAAIVDAVRGLRAGVDVEGCFAVLDHGLRPRLLRYFVAHSFSRDDAEDLVQKTLVRVYQGVGRLRAEESLLPWLFTIARNVRRSARGREQRDGRVLAGGVEPIAEVPDPRPGAEEDHLKEERVEALREAVEQLPAQQRQCLLLRVDRDLSYEEVADTLHLSVHTVRNHLAQARKSLRRMCRVGVLEGDDGP